MRRVQGGRGGGSRGGGPRGGKGVVVATGSGLSLEELADAEEAETGVRPKAILLAPATGDADADADTWFAC